MKFSKLFVAAAITVSASVSLTSCSDDDKPTPVYPVTLSIQLPQEISGAQILGEEYTFRNISNLRVSTFTSAAEIEIVPGLYDITYTAKVRLPNGVESTMRAQAQGVQINAGDNNIPLTAYNTIESDDLIIAEIFCPGTTNVTGKQNRDQYIKLYNNTDHVIYADGISMFESDFSTLAKYDYTPDIMGEAVVVRAVYTVPGDGTKFPVKPGEYFLMADRANDHRKIDANSFDLSHADCEWYDESSVASQQDTDNPDVPNMDKVYSYTKSIYILDQRQRAIGIARLGDAADNFLTDNIYNATYEVVIPSTGAVHTMTKDAYFIPNTSVIDVVNISTKDNYQWNVTSPALDCGYTWFSSNSSDKTSYFHSVRRKMLYLNDDGNPVLKDTNNSSDDFNARVTPSEIELQGAATDAAGTPATTRTYDGVTPMH